MKNADKPAYPTEVAFNDGEPSESYQTSEHTGIFPGLTKREYFAAMFMSQIIAGEGAKMVAARDGRYDETNWKEVCAANALEFADELLKQLEA